MSKPVVQNKNQNKSRNMDSWNGSWKKVFYNVLILFIVAFLISIPFLIRISKIYLIYTDPKVRESVYQSTLSLESNHGILLSAIHLSSVEKMDNIIVSTFKFTYPSHTKFCQPIYIKIYYDDIKGSVVDEKIPYDEKTICG